MSTLNTIEASLAAKAGHPPSPEVEQAVAATQDATPPAPKADDDSQAASQPATAQAAPPEAVDVEPDDWAGSVLKDAPIDHNLKADAWDAVQHAKSVDDLARNLASFKLPPHIVASLLVARKLIDTEHPEPTRAQKVKAAGQQMATIPPATLELMENHPNVMKHMLSEPSKKD